LAEKDRLHSGIQQMGTIYFSNSQEKYIPPTNAQTLNPQKQNKAVKMVVDMSPQ
tara:strand:- start:89 stop:250 length:162 start_codon:yes stop_codon:yes gene_type:complete